MRKKKKIISSIRIPSLYIRHERWCFGWRLLQQCSSNYGMSVIWLRKQPNSLMLSSSNLLAPCLLKLYSDCCCCAAKRIETDRTSGISSSKSFLVFCLRHWSIVFWWDVGGLHNSGNMPEHSPNSLSVSWFAFIRLIENPAISSDVMKDPHITLATTTPRLSICIRNTN